MIEFRFHGRGGQGAVTAADLVAQAAISSNLYAQTFPSFGAERRGAAIGHIFPEAAEGGPLALVQEGDSILIDIPNRTLTLEVSEEEMSRRREAWAAPELKVKEGYLYRYAKIVSSANTGAILKA